MYFGHKVFAAFSLNNHSPQACIFMDCITTFVPSLCTVAFIFACGLWIILLSTILQLLFWTLHKHSKFDSWGWCVFGIRYTVRLNVKILYYHIICKMYYYSYLLLLGCIIPLFVLQYRYIAFFIFHEVYIIDIAIKI